MHAYIEWMMYPPKCTSHILNDEEEFGPTVLKKNGLKGSLRNQTGLEELSLNQQFRVIGNGIHPKWTGKLKPP